MFRWLDRLSDEGHRSERIAFWWHMMLVTGAVGEAVWHLWAAKRHWRASRTLILGALFLAVGCATVADQPSTLCLPPGITPDIFTAPVIRIRPFRIKVEGGEHVPGVYLRFQVGDRHIMVIYAPVGLIAVDIAPDDKDVPEWVNLRLVMPDGTIRRQPEGPCRWDRVQRGA